MAQTKAVRKSKKAKLQAKLGELSDDLTREGVEHDLAVLDLRETAKDLKGIKIPPAQIEKFGPRLDRIVVRLDEIATSLQKAIALELLKADREAKKAERVEARKQRALKHIESLKEKLAKYEKELE